MKFELCAVFALFAVAVEDGNFLVGKFELSNDGRWSEACVEHDGNTDFLVSITGQSLADVLEGRALGVLADLQAAATFKSHLLVFVVPLVVCAKKTKLKFEMMI